MAWLKERRGKKTRLFCVAQYGISIMHIIPISICISKWLYLKCEFDSFFFRKAMMSRYAVEITQYAQTCKFVTLHVYIHLSNVIAKSPIKIRNDTATTTIKNGTNKYNENLYKDDRTMTTTIKKKSVTHSHLCCA